MIKALSGARIFDGTRFREGQSVLIQSGKIVDILPANIVPSGIDRIRLPGGILAPGFIDAQVNGGGGILFNDEPNVETIRTIIAAHRPFGTTGLLPTLITDREPVIHAAIAAAQKAVRTVPGCLGLHLEGPFLAPHRKGAHLAEFMRPMLDDDLDWLTTIDAGRLLLTVATEQVTPAQITALSRSEIIVSLGHCDATMASANAAISAGARGITHLFNAMSQMTPREPGLVGAALSAGNVWCGVIADGYHVHPETLKIAIKAKRRGKIFLVSDAMSTVGWKGDSIKLNGRIITREGGRLTLPDGTLAGSDLDMASAVRYCVEKLDVPLTEALRMASLYSAQFLGLAKTRGRIRKGMIADLVHLDGDLHVTRTWIAGKDD